jgi:ADP-ribose pyrophosphatase
MPKSLPDATLAEGRYLRLVRRNGTEEYRVPLGKFVIGCPAGLIGDLEDETESLEAAVVRELEEEAGYTASKVTSLTHGPTSAGQSNEVIWIVLAEGLKKIGKGGGVGGEQIHLHEVPLKEIDSWLEDRVAKGELIDPKVYTVLYFVRHKEKKKVTPRRSPKKRP